MLTLQKILVPVDFSERSVAAAEHAAVMAARFNSELIFQYVVPPGPYNHGFFEAGYNESSVWPSRAEIEEGLTAQMEQFIAKTSRGRPVNGVVCWGEPAAQIEELAEHEQVDLIMMPTHGYGPFRRFALGSLTTKVLHDLTFPVFTGVHVEELPESLDDPYEVVACAVDLSPHSEDVLRWAADFAKAWDASLHVIHAGPSLDAVPTDGQSLPSNLKESLIRLKTDQARELLEKVGCEATLHVDCDDVVGCVVAEASGIRADVLIIGRGSETGLIGRLRTHSYGLIREAPCPVISI